jgi:hypothetical protein
MEDQEKQDRKRPSRPFDALAADFRQRFSSPQLNRSFERFLLKPIASPFEIRSCAVALCAIVNSTYEAPIAQSGSYRYFRETASITQSRRCFEGEPPFER